MNCKLFTSLVFPLVLEIVVSAVSSLKKMLKDPKHGSSVSGKCFSTCTYQTCSVDALHYNKMCNKLIYMRHPVSTITLTTSHIPYLNECKMTALHSP